MRVEPRGSPGIPQYLPEFPASGYGKPTVSEMKHAAYGEQSILVHETAARIDVKNATESSRRI